MYRDLIAWQKAYKFTIEVYKATKNFPKEELFGLTSQMRRAVASIPANLAEGSMRQSNREYKQYIHIAKGSMAEMEVWIQLSHDLGYINDIQHKELNELCTEVGKLLSGLLKSI